MATVKVRVFPEMAHVPALAHEKTSNFWIDPPIIEFDPAHATDIEFVSLGGESLNIDMTKLHPGAAATGPANPGAPLTVSIPAGAVPQGMYVYAIRVRWQPTGGGQAVWKKAHANSDPRAKVYP